MAEPTNPKSIEEIGRLEGNTTASVSDQTTQNAREKFRDENLPEETVKNQKKIDSDTKAMTESALDSAMIGKRLARPGTLNPLLRFNAEIVEITKSTIQGPVEEKVLRRDIAIMAEHNRKEDTVASLKIIKENTSDIKNVRDEYTSAITRKPEKINNIPLDSTDVLFSTTNFILQSIVETDSEKVQVIDNFGDPQIFLFGRKPRFYTYSGMLWNTKLNNWKDEFIYIYDTYLRGTKCVDFGTKVLLTFDRSVRIGYIINFTRNQNSDFEMGIPISFTMFIEEEKQLIDTGLIDPAGEDASEDENIIDTFRLVSLQRDETSKNARDLAEAVTRKIEINKKKKIQLNSKSKNQTGDNASIEKKAEIQAKNTAVTPAKTGSDVTAKTKNPRQQQPTKKPQTGIKKTDTKKSFKEKAVDGKKKKAEAADKTTENNRKVLSKTLNEAQSEKNKEDHSNNILEKGRAIMSKFEGQGAD